MSPRPIQIQAPLESLKLATAYSNTLSLGFKYHGRSAGTTNYTLVGADNTPLTPTGNNVAESLRRITMFSPGYTWLPEV